MRLTAVAVVALGLASPAAAGVPDPCALLTNMEVAGQLGSKVSSRTHSNGGYVCTWTAGGRLTLKVTVWTPTKEQFELGAHAPPRPVRVLGVGQEAYESRGKAPFLLVWQEGVALRVDTSLTTEPGRVEQALARVAVSRISGRS